MNEEEKQAIKELKNFKSDKDCKFWIGLNGEKAIDIIINLISKQQELIELYLTEIKYYRDVEEKYKNLKQLYKDVLDTIPLEFISKNKIKAKIEELKTRTIGASTGIYAAQVDILEEILNEEQE